MKLIVFMSAYFMLFVMSFVLTGRAMALQSSNCNVVQPPSFEELDSSGDGFISEEEAGAFPCLDFSFNLHDADRDGLISTSEYTQFVSKFEVGELICCDDSQP